MVKFFPDRIENIVEKGENTGFQNFLFFPRFQKASFSALLKMGLCGNGLTLPNDKILPSSTLFVENDFRMVDMVQFFFDRVENIVEKGERLVSGILSFSHNGFKRLLFQARENLWLFWKVFKRKKKLVIGIISFSHIVFKSHLSSELLEVGFI